MNSKIRVVLVLTAIALAGCSTDVAAPEKAVAVRKLTTSAISDQSSDYIVLMKGSRIAAGFAESVAKLGGTVTYANGNAGFATVSGISPAAASQIGAISGVGEIEPDATVALDAPLAAAEADAASPGNPSAASVLNPASAHFNSWQWDMKAIHAEAAWNAGKLGSRTVTAAILDTGMDYDDPDLAGQVEFARSTSFMSTFVKATDTSTVRPADDTVSKYSFPGRNPISDYNGHGTNVATQVSSNAIVFAGVTSKTTLIGVKVLGSNGAGSFGTILSGVLWAADHGADVANMSLGAAFSKAGNGRFVGAINKVFNYAKQQGMLIVVAAGNFGEDLQHNGNQYVAFCDAPHVMCVSSVGPTTWGGNPDVPAFYTDFGRSVVSVAAPGGNAAFNPDGKPKVSFGWPWGPPPAGAGIASWVWSFCSKTRIFAWPASGPPYTAPCASGRVLSGFIGTSQATAHVTGLAALLVDEYGHGQPQLIKRLIEQSADPIDPLYGRGRISVKNALGL